MYHISYSYFNVNITKILIIRLTADKNCTEITIRRSQLKHLDIYTIFDSKILVISLSKDINPWRHDTCRLFAIVYYNASIEIDKNTGARPILTT